MKNIQKLEEHIMGCWNLVDNLRDTIKGIRSTDLSPTQIIIILEGLVALYEIKFNEAFNVYEQLLKKDYNGR